MDKSPFRPTCSEVPASGVMLGAFLDFHSRQLTVHTTVSTPLNQWPLFAALFGGFPTNSLCPKSQRGFFCLPDWATGLRSLFICAFSLYQCEDHYGPTIAEQLGSLPQASPSQLPSDHGRK